MDFNIPRINSAATDPANVGITDADNTPSCSEKADLFDSSQIFVGECLDIEKQHKIINNSNKLRKQ